MHTPIADCLNTLELGAPIVHGRLAMHPLLAGHDRAPDYLTLDQAMDQNLCEVRELTEVGHVTRLVRGYGLEAFDPLHAGQPPADAPLAAVLNRPSRAEPSHHRAAGLGAAALLHAGRSMRLDACAGSAPSQAFDG